MKNIDTQNHVLVPKHEVLSDKDKKDLLDNYSIAEIDIPRILNTDAAIKDLKCKSGDIIKITRNSPTADQAIFYRVVVNA